GRIWRGNRFRKRAPSARAPVTLTDEQRRAVAGMEHAISRGSTFALHGLAGTGKTTVAAHVALSRPRSILCAPTAKAASVLREKTGADASTIHSAFYHFVREEDDETEGAQPRRRLIFRPKYKPGELRGELALLDECSMVGSQMARDIMA